jgi:hypothetical protein
VLVCGGYETVTLVASPLVVMLYVSDVVGVYAYARLIRQPDLQEGR